MSRPAAALAGLLEHAGPAERVEVFARHTETALVRTGSRTESSEQAGDHWLIEIRSVLDGRLGAARTGDWRPASLHRALAAARAIAAAAPAPALPVSELAVGRLDELDGHRTCDFDRLRKLAGQLSDQSGPGCAASVAATGRSVLLLDSTGRAGSYRTGEHQLHVRSELAGQSSVQAASIITQPPDELGPLLAELAELAEDYDRVRTNLTASPAPAAKLGWLLLSPMATARILSRLAPSLIAASGRIGAVQEQLGSPAFTLVDDATLPGGPASCPFDDEGITTRRTVLIDHGKQVASLRALPLAEATGNASRDEHSFGTGTAVNNCFLQATDDPTGDLPPDDQPGLVVEAISGFRGGLDLQSSRLQFAAEGQLVIGGLQAGTARHLVAASPRQLLQAFEQVRGPAAFYRIKGAFGGNWCLLRDLETSPS